MPNWKIRHEIRPGDIGFIIYLHGTLYAREKNYDLTFEAYVAHGLLQFVQNYNPYRDRLWLVESNNQIIGCIGVVRTTKEEAQLRWYLVDPEFRGQGIGKQLLAEALNFCREKKYKTVFIWTTSELPIAAHIYSQAGFKKKTTKSHTIWGKQLVEERYDLVLVPG
jgi:N-acetylglutamate synthase-like GNAT family acetyltransferase